MRLKKFVLIVFLFCPLFLTFTSCKRHDDLTFIQKALSDTVRAAEKKDKDKVLRVLDDDYQDFQNRDVRATSELLDYYFKHYSGIVIHLLQVEIVPEQAMAEVRADVLLSSGPLEILRKTIGLVGSFYRFEFKMAKRSTGWKITHARWQEVEQDCLLPGSKVILKKLFPDLF
ncbi:MAG: hypothetical protein ACPLPQ_00695 [Candidatus Saccharicenans sp.]